MSSFKQLSVNKRSGSEVFHSGNEDLGFNLLSFWQWSSSDVVSNTTRGILAEYIVGRALDCIKDDDVRDEWGAYDLMTQSGVRVEVKSAAYIQSWHQSKLSKINFVVPKTFGWNRETNKLDTEKKRQADVYVFALLLHKDKKSINPLDISQWEFYVLPTKVLDQKERRQHSITLASLKKLSASVLFVDLYQAVEKSAVNADT